MVDHNNPDLQEKLNILTSRIEDDNSDISNDDDTFFKNRGTLRLKTSAKLRQMIVQRD